MNSWHDSDEVDSDIECEAYNMLYHDSHNENMKMNGCMNKDKDNGYLRNIEACDSDIDSETPLEDNIIIISDSDDSFVAKKIVCSNKVSCLSIGISSDTDDSDYAKINSHIIETTNSSFILNMNNSSCTKDFGIPLKIGYNNDWSVDNVDIEPRSKYRNRYFNDQRSAVCEVCLKKGHSDEDCTRAGPVCILCGKEGHLSNDCDDIICHICFQTDHLAKQCTQITPFFKNGCRRCGQRGHSEDICPDLWRQYKYTISSGQPNNQKFPSQTSTWTTKDVLCANCGRVGHYTDNCTKNRMKSRFIGPAPIMEIVHFDSIDIYKGSGLRYTDTYIDGNVVPKLSEEVDSMIMNMDVNGLIKDIYEDNIIKIDSSNIGETLNKNADFGDGYIMLSPIVKAKSTNSLERAKRVNMKCSTPGPQLKSRTPLKMDKELMESTLPILPESFLKKLFPTETQNIVKLTPGLRSKLRKKLRKLLKKGYVTGDTQMTQNEMDSWLQEIANGRSMSYKEENNSLSRSGLATQCLKHNGSSDSEEFSDIAVITNIPESRRKKNKALRQIKRFQNELKVLQKENNKKNITKEVSADPAVPLKTRLRKRKSNVSGGDLNEAKKAKLKRSGGNKIAELREESCCV